MCERLCFAASFLLGHCVYDIEAWSFYSPYLSLYHPFELIHIHCEYRSLHFEARLKVLADLENKV